MLNHRTVLAIVILLSASIIGIGTIAGIRWYEKNACRYGDLRLCGFESWLKKETFENVAGTYNVDHTGKKIKAEFNFYDGTKEITLHNDTKKILHMIEDDPYMYLSNPADQNWYRQRVFIAENYEYSRPSGVHSFFLSLKKWLLENDMSASFKGKSTCDNEQCYFYELQLNDPPTRVEVYLTEEHALSRIVIEEEIGTQEVIFKNQSNKIVIPKTFTAVGNENVFVKIITQEEDTPTYDYVEEIEKGRQDLD